jgi:hypothetical protein
MFETSATALKTVRRHILQHHNLKFQVAEEREEKVGGNVRHYI